MVHPVVRGPHPLVRGNGHHECPPRLEPGRNRGERGMIVVDMLDHVERPDKIVMAIGNAGELGQRRAHDLATEPLLRQRARLVVELQSFDVAEARQHRQIVAGAAPDLEDLRILGQVRLTADQLSNDLAPRAVPPMSVVELGHLRVNDALHQRNTIWLLSPKVASGVTKIAGINGHPVGPWTKGPVSTQVNASLSRKPEAWTRRN